MLEMLKDFKNMVDELNSTNSRNDKLDILAKHERCKKIIDYTLNPFKKFGVTSKNCEKLKKKLDPDVSGFTPDRLPSYSFFDMLDKMSSGVLSGHGAVTAILRLVKLYPDYKTYIYNVIDKDLKVRMGAKDINKVFPKLIPMFELTLASTPKGKDLSKVNDKWVIEQKLDGCVSYDTLVEFENGDLMKIGDIVKDKIHGKIKSYNHSKNIVEYMDIIGYSKNEVDLNEDTTDWFEITLSNGKILEITGNDMVYLPVLGCYRRVDELDGTEELMIG